VAAMLLRGNARCEKLMVGSRVVGLQFLDPRRLWIGCGSDGKKECRYTERDGKQRIIPRDRIWNVPGFTLDGIEGVSVVAYGARVFGSALAADTAASTTFEKGLHPTTYWKYPNVRRADQRADARATIKQI